jgi:Flp pilus assembly protein TadG
MTHPSSHTGWSFKNALRCDRGQALVEFALVIIFLFLLVLGILEMLFFMNTYNVLADSAKEGVRYAIVHGANNTYAVGPDCSTSCPKIDGPAGPSLAAAEDPTSSYGIVKTFAQYSLHDTGAMAVTTTYGPADSPAVTPLNKTPNRVQVVVSYPYHPFFGLGWPTVTVNAAAEGRIMN